MGLLRDQDLVANISAPPPAIPYIEGLELPANPYSTDSPIQSSSVDLHIGNIYLPGKKPEDEGGAQNPKSDHVLRTGETAVVTSRETLHLPGNVAGLGYPPSRVSFRGLLMTNPGHVDPGYQGVMRFTVINMAKDPYALERGKEIVTLLLFSMDQAAHADWHQRNPGGSHLPTQAQINRLSEDFVNVESRAKKIANKKGVQWTLVVTILASILVALLQALGGGRLFYGADIEELKKRQDLVEYDLKNRVDIERRLQDFDNRLKDLAGAKSNITSGQKMAQGLEKKTTNPPGRQP
jgi:deoxycytidine triphosphate deaminase